MHHAVQHQRDVVVFSRRRGKSTIATSSVSHIWLYRAVRSNPTAADTEQFCSTHLSGSTMWLPADSCMLNLHSLQEPPQRKCRTPLPTECGKEDLDEISSVNCAHALRAR